MRDLLKDVLLIRKIFIATPNLANLEAYLHVSFAVLNSVGNYLRVGRDQLIADYGEPLVARSMGSIAWSATELVKMKMVEPPSSPPVCSLNQVRNSIDRSLIQLCLSVADEIGKHRKEWADDLGWLWSRVVWLRSAPRLARRPSRLSRSAESAFAALAQMPSPSMGHAEEQMKLLLTNELPDAIEDFQAVGGISGRDLRLRERRKYEIIIASAAALIGAALVLTGVYVFGFA